MTPPHPSGDLVGRDRLLARLGRLVDGMVAGPRTTALVAGEAGIGKTTLLRAAAALATDRGARTAWGTAVDLAGAPGYWPWTQALDGLVRAVGIEATRRAVGDDAALLAAIVPSFGEPPAGDRSERERLLVMDATSRLLETLAAERPVVVILDDLQWADESSLALFEFVARLPAPGPVGLIGAYRPHDLPAAALPRLVGAVAGDGHLPVAGLDPEAVGRLVEQVTGRAVDPATAEAVHRRTGGHPFFVRHLALLGDEAGAAPGEERPVPAAVRDVINRRAERLPPDTVAVLETAAVLGTDLLPDVVAAGLRWSVAEVDAAARAAVDAGMLIRAGTSLRFAHDLLRETILDRVDSGRRVPLHRAIGAALEDRTVRGEPVAPAEVARHFTAAVPVDGPQRAARWALEAAAADCAALAFGEAAAHLRRLRAAVANAGVALDDPVLADVLLAEADALARAGRTLDARGLLRHAADVAVRAGDPGRIAAAALASAALGARFAMRRDEIVGELEAALAAVAGTDDGLEARLTATLARELQHSVPEDRPRAGPLSQRALELGRRSGDPATLLACLLARHDVLWTPGGEGARVGIAREIAAAALAAGDRERHADGLLLLANAQLEQGSPAFEAALESCLAILDGLGQPRHRYTAATRRACLALLRGRLDEADDRIERAAVLGDRLREPDTGNVRMSQRLELVRARADAEELSAFAVAAVDHWTGAPVHAHAVAAGFCARAGDLEGAARHTAAVADLGSWRADRSYLWSVFVRELAVAAVAIGDRALAAALFEELEPLAGGCGVNGAVVAFAGSHAHTAGLLAGALGNQDLSRRLFEQAGAVYRRLGATGWLAEVRAHLGEGVTGATGSKPGLQAAMRRQGAVWEVSFAARRATVPHAKGLSDIARLLAAAGAEIHVLDLFDAADRSGVGGEVADRRAIDHYRRRLTDLEANVAEAEANHDLERRAAAEAERQALIEELGRITGLGGRPRSTANHPAERARKAVTARIRDAIRKLEPSLPELAAHLERTVVTGAYCRYRPDGTTWDVAEESSPR